jgi:hypothetical protein
VSRDRIPEWYDDERLSSAPGWRERALRARLETLLLMVEALGGRVAALEREARMPFKSERQRRAMYAAAGGHSTLGIPKSAARKFIKHSKRSKGRKKRRT